MRLTPEERTEREKQRRKVANAQMREKVAAAKKLGICRCGGQLDKKPGTEKYYSICPECREKARVSATRYYRKGPLERLSKPPVKIDYELEEYPGVRRRIERDGLGREAWWWFASAVIDGRNHMRRWSVEKYGDRGAWRLAKAQRREWEKSMSRKRQKKKRKVRRKTKPDA